MFTPLFCPEVLPLWCLSYILVSKGRTHYPISFCRASALLLPSYLSYLCLESSQLQKIGASKPIIKVRDMLMVIGNVYLLEKVGALTVDEFNGMSYVYDETT